MMLDIKPESIQKFINLYKDEFRATLTYEDAEMVMKQLLDLLWAMAQDLPEEKGE